MKTQIRKITFILVCFLFINCDNENSSQEEEIVTIEDINKLSDDSLYIEYLEKKSSQQTELLT